MASPEQAPKTDGPTSETRNGRVRVDSLPSQDELDEMLEFSKANPGLIDGLTLDEAMAQYRDIQAGPSFVIDDEEGSAPRSGIVDLGEIEAVIVDQSKPTVGRTDPIEVAREAFDAAPAATTPTPASASASAARAKSRAANPTSADIASEQYELRRAKVAAEEAAELAAAAAPAVPSRAEKRAAQPTSGEIAQQEFEIRRAKVAAEQGGEPATTSAGAEMTEQDKDIADIMDSEGLSRKKAEKFVRKQYAIGDLMAENGLSEQEAGELYEANKISTKARKYGWGLLKGVGISKVEKPTTQPETEAETETPEAESGFEQPTFDIFETEDSVEQEPDVQAKKWARIRSGLNRVRQFYNDKTEDSMVAFGHGLISLSSRVTSKYEKGVGEDFEAYDKRMKKLGNRVTWGIGAVATGVVLYRLFGADNAPTGGGSVLPTVETPGTDLSDVSAHNSGILDRGVDTAPNALDTQVNIPSGSDDTLNPDTAPDVLESGLDTVDTDALKEQADDIIKRLTPEQIAAFDIPKGSGGEALTQRLGIDKSVWYNNQHDLLKLFPKDLYLMDDGNVGFSRPGVTKDAMIKYITEKSGILG